MKKNIFTKKNLRYVFNALLVIAGTFCMGVAFNVFLNANRISPSGFSGLSAVISNVLMAKFGINIPASVFYLTINGILFIVSFKTMGINFAINSAIGIVSYSIFIEVCKFDIGLGSGDLLLCAIYGGVLMGIGLGLVFRGRGSTGGSDMLANLLNKRFRFLTVGNLVLIVDAVVLILSFIAYKDLNLALYSLIAIVIMTKMSDMIVSGVQGVRAYYIITAVPDVVSQKIMTDLHRGVTGLDGKGMYTKKETNVLMVVVTRAETARLRMIISECDKKAFVYSTAISEAMGSGFLPLDANANKKPKEVKAKKVKNLEQINLIEKQADKVDME